MKDRFETSFSFVIGLGALSMILTMSHGKYGTEALNEVRKQISITKLSDEALQKRMERAEKVYKLFNGIGKSKIARIRTFPARFILNLSDNNVYHVIAGVSRANQ